MAPTTSTKVTGGFSAEAECENPFWLPIGDGTTLTDAIASTDNLISYANTTGIRCGDEAPTKVPGGFQVALDCAAPNPGPYLGSGATVTAAARSALSQVTWPDVTVRPPARAHGVHAGPMGVARRGLATRHVDRALVSGPPAYLVV